MNKTLKFSPDLVPLILSGEKTLTWRLWDDKDLQVGDMVTFIRIPELTPFATAKITSAVEKPMGQLTEEDKRSHETFESDEEMYNTYTKYYGKPVGHNTLVKIIRFELPRNR